MSKSIDLDAIIQNIKGVLPQDRELINLHEPCFSGNEWKYVKECLDTGWVSSAGKFVDRFEVMLSEYTGIKYAVATVNGTAALHICLLLAGVEPEDEVLIPALTFVATANTVSYCGAVPHFVDSEERTLGLDPHKLGSYLKDISEVRGGYCFNKQTGRRIKAVVPMHTFGHPVDMDPLMSLCKKYNLGLVEDAAEALGSYYKGRHVGNFGLVNALSFNGNKVITTGGGGAILTNNETYARHAKHITTTARMPHKWSFIHDIVGFNYRLPNINAALGCAQLEQLSGFLEKKRRLAKQYEDAFKGVPGVKFFTETDFVQSNYWLNTLILDGEYAQSRDRILEITNNAGIMTRPVWTLMHTLDMFKRYPRMDLRAAENLEKRIVNIPSSAILGEAYV